MATGVRLTGDYNRLKSDLNRLSNELAPKTQYEFEKLMRRTGRHWSQKYNNMMNRDGKSSLAKSKINKVTRGKTVNVTVSVPQKGIWYDLQKPHWVSLKHTRVKNWVKRNWSYNDDGWKARQRAPGSKGSKIYGTASNPKGSLYVQSRKDKTGKSIIETANNSSVNYINNELTNNLGNGLSKAVREIMSKNVYKIKMVVTI